MEQGKRMGIAAFTGRGNRLADTLALAFAGEYECLRYRKGLHDWCRTCFEQADAVVFIGACGIAVRTIAPFLKSKTVDPAVLVLDEAGQYVISLLSGHLGGANELALAVARKIGATPVITTASDVNGTIAVDVFAKKNRLQIGSMLQAKRIAAALLRRERVGFFCSGMVEGVIPPELTRGKAQHLIWVSEREPDASQTARFLEHSDGTVLHLIPRCVVLGVGCRKGKSAQEIREVADELLQKAQVSPQALCGAASIDLKKDEAGLLECCRAYGVELNTYTAEELLQAAGTFAGSEFVRQTTGVDNVCERAALLAAGPGGRLIAGKYAKNGVTAALAVQDWRVRFEE